jgi:hypothetical protein
MSAPVVPGGFQSPAIPAPVYSDRVAPNSCSADAARFLPHPDCGLNHEFVSLEYDELAAGHACGYCTDRNARLTPTGVPAPPGPRAPGAARFDTAADRNDTEPRVPAPAEACASATCPAPAATHAVQCAPRQSTQARCEGSRCDGANAGGTAPAPDAPSSSAKATVARATVAGVHGVPPLRPLRR